MIFKLKILLLLLPTFLISNEWEKVDLPNLNNGIIRSLHKVDSIFVIEKQDHSLIVSTDFENWVDLDSSEHKDNVIEDLYFIYYQEIRDYIKKKDKFNKLLTRGWCTYSKSGLLVYDDTLSTVTFESYENGNYKEKFSIEIKNGWVREVQSRDEFLYFIKDDTLFTIDSEVVSKVKVDISIYDESHIAAIHYDDEIYLKSSIQKFYKVKDDSLIVLDSSDITERLALLLYIDPNVYLMHEVNISIDDTKIPEYTFIEIIYVVNNLIITSSHLFGEKYFIDLNNMNVYNKYELNEQLNFRLVADRINNFYLNFVNSSYSTDKQTFSECKVDIYNTKLNKVKTIEFDYDDPHRPWCSIGNQFEEYLILNNNGDRLKLDLKSLEYEKLFYADIKSKCYYSESVIFNTGPFYYPNSYRQIYDASANASHQAIYYYSLDGGDSWVLDTLIANVSDKKCYSCYDGGNKHELAMIGSTVYSFSSDTVYTAEFGEKQLKSILYVDFEYFIEYGQKIVFLDHNTDTVYILHEKGKYTSLKCPVEGVVNISIDNGILYAANNKELYRLKLE